jgi:hypothetical protein
MRVMVLIKANKDIEAGATPDEKVLTEMGNFNEELAKAGLLIGMRVRFSGTNRSVIDGPFAETKELIAGYWLWKVKSMDEAIEWVKRCPRPTGVDCEIEIRRVFELDDFGPELAPEVRAQEERLLAQVAARS